MTLIPSVLLALALGCKDKPDDTGSPPGDGGGDGGTDAGDWLVGTEQGWATLDALADRYAVLRQTLDATAAQAALADEANAGFDGVSAAVLVEGGQALVVTLADGSTGAVVTDEERFPDAAPSPPPGASALPGPPPFPTPIAGGACDPGATCPQSHHVRIFNSASISDPKSSTWARTLKDKLIALGWSEDEVEIVERTENGELLDPYHLLDMSGEGLVFYVGHGGSWALWPWAEEGHHYVMLSSAGPGYDEIMDPAALAAIREYDGTHMFPVSMPIKGPDGKPTGEKSREVVIDVALLGELGTVDPGTMLFTTSCNSMRAKDTLLDAGLSSCVTWDGSITDREAIEAYQAMLTDMMAGSSQQAATDALTEVEATTPEGTVVDVASTSDAQYLPAWGELTVQAGDLPAGADHYSLELPRSGSTLLYEDLQQGDTVSYDGVLPVGADATLRIYDSTGRLLEARAVPLDLTPGPQGSLDLPDGARIGMVLSAEPTTVPADGKSTATLTATLRAYGPEDLVDPTGPPLECRTVEFDTDFGQWVGESTAVTGGDGTAQVLLASDTPGTATVHALVELDMVEALAPATVRFGGYLAARTGGIWPDHNPWVPDRINQIQDAVFVIDEDYQEVCYGTWLGWINAETSSCGACTEAWFFSFEEFTEYGGDCAKFGYYDGVAQGQRGYGVGADGSLHVWDGEDWVEFGSYETSELEYEGEDGIEIYIHYGFQTEWGDLAW